MRKKEFYTEEQVESAQNALKLLATKKTITKTVMVETLKQEIIEARRAGKSYKEIQEAFNNVNINVSIRTIVLALEKKD